VYFCVDILLGANAPSIIECNVDRRYSQNFNLEGNRVTPGKNTNLSNPSNRIKLQYFFIQYIMDSTDRYLTFTLLRASLYVLGQNLIILEGRSIVGTPNLALARELELRQRPSVRTIEQHTGAHMMPPANMGPQEKKIWLAQERQKAEKSHKRKLDFQAAGGAEGDDVPYYAPLPNKRSRVVKNKSGSGSKQGQDSKKLAKPRAKPSFPVPVLPGSAEEARLLGERDPNLDDELKDIPVVRPTDMRYARGWGESDEEDVPLASEDEDDPAYDPSSGEESGDAAGGARPVANFAGRAPRNPSSSGGVASQGASNRLAIVAAKSREFPAGAWLHYSIPHCLLLEGKNLLLWGLNCGARWFNA
jgi:hypothetical protein